MCLINGLTGKKKTIMKYSVNFIKIAMFNFTFKTLNTIRNTCVSYNFSNIHYRDLLYDTMNFRLRFFSDSCSETVLFTLNFQQKSFNDFKIKQIH